MDIQVLIDRTHQVSGTKPIISLSDLKEANKVFYELNDHYGRTKLGLFHEVNLNNQENFYEYYKRYLDNGTFKSEDDLLKHFSYHNFRYI